MTFTPQYDSTPSTAIDEVALTALQLEMLQVTERRGAAGHTVVDISAIFPDATLGTLTTLEWLDADILPKGTRQGGKI